ncbi:MAG TPA: AsmA-like C-terminal region-containing protein, partial [Gemmatimonadaceae bacterium]|nr:AsmA-like C-terminal region-containing protein [Gemmatimonadaceae bacterium]
DVRRTVKLDGVQELSGTVAADVATRARLSDVDAGRYDRVAARGTVNVARLALKSSSLPRALMVDTAALALTPRAAEIESFAARIGNSDVRATGSLDNVLGFALRDEELRGRASVSSNRFDLNEWRSDDPTLEVIPVPANVDFALQAAAARVNYGAITATNVRGGLHVKDRRVTLDDLHMDLLGGSVVANGSYETTNTARPTFDLGLKVATVDVPSAFAALVTVQKLAPMAKWAQGSISGDVAMKGALGKDMTPTFDALTGRGTVESERLALQGAPVLAKLSESLALAQLRNPALQALKASFEITNGRVAVKPFDVKVGNTMMRIGGSSGIDQSLAYDLALAVPHADIDAAAGRTVSKLASQAGKAGLDIAAAEVVELGARITGTFTNPTVKPNFAGVASSAREAVQNAARHEVETRVATVKQQVDSVAYAARGRARAEADRMVQEAEQQAATIRAEARTLADSAKANAGRQADALVERATTPSARLAAKVGADRIRKQADQQADRAVREADARADALVAKARQQAAALAPPGKS